LALWRFSDDRQAGSLAGGFIPKQLNLCAKGKKVLARLSRFFPAKEFIPFQKGAKIKSIPYYSPGPSRNSFPKIIFLNASIVFSISPGFGKKSVFSITGGKKIVHTV
jgi:hypothetical protein